MIGIVNEEYMELHPMPPNKKKAVTVFNFKDAKHIFTNVPMVDFVVCLNEITMKFAFCYSIMECAEFYDIK